MTKEEFMAKAKSIKITVDGKDFLAAPKAFASGSWGYYLTGKTTTAVGGEDVELVIGSNFVIKGSKPKVATPTKKGPATVAK